MVATLRVDCGQASVKTQEPARKYWNNSGDR